MNTRPSLQEIVNELAHTQVRDCYQCGKCTAGCPAAGRMEIAPNQLVRLVQAGQLERALVSEALWHCVSCQTCTTRCPKSVNCAGVLDALRQIAVERGIESPAQQRTTVFLKAFLANIRKNGRVGELELVGQFKTRVFLKDLNIPFLMKDALLGPKMMGKGKLHLVGEKAKDRAVVDRIFAKCLAQTHETVAPEEGHKH